MYKRLDSRQLLLLHWMELALLKIEIINWRHSRQMDLTLTGWDQQQTGRAMIDCPDGRAVTGLKATLHGWVLLI